MSLRDQDDLHLGSLTHPGGVVWSAVVACAGDRATWGDALGAAALGYELTVRLAVAAGPEHRARWHGTATAGTAGAAGAGAQLLAPGSDAVVDAVAHAVSVAGGSIHAMVERSGTRFLHRAHAASSGVACARAAAEGLPGSRHGLGTARGAFATGDPDALAAALVAPRPVTALEETGFRLHAANGFAHAAIDAAETMGPLEPAGLDSVRVLVSPAGAVALASNPAPANDEEAWWSTEHAVAVCLASGDAGALTGGLTVRDDVRALCRRVTLEAAGAQWEASVEAARLDGSVARGHADEPRGHGAHPASDEDLLRKWRSLTGSDGSALLSRLDRAGDDEPFLPLVERALSR